MTSMADWNGAGFVLRVISENVVCKILKVKWYLPEQRKSQIACLTFVWGATAPKILAYRIEYVINKMMTESSNSLPTTFLNYF